MSDEEKERIALLCERKGLFNGGDDSRARREFVVPAGDKWEFLEGRADSLMTPYPPEMSDVRDAVLITCSKRMTLKILIEYAQRPVNFSKRTFLCIGLRGRLHPNQESLQECRAETGRVEEELLENLCATGTIRRKKLPGLLSEVDQDCGGFAKYYVAIPENGTIDEDRDLRVEIHCLEGIGLLFTLPQVDGNELIVEPHLLQCNWNLDGVGGCECENFKLCAHKNFLFGLIACSDD